MNTEKYIKVVSAIKEKTENKKIEWMRIEKNDFENNPFLYRHFSDNDMAFDVYNSYKASYNKGTIYFTNQEYDSYRQVSIQPEEGKAFTVLDQGNDELLQELEKDIKAQVDNPDDFLDSLLDD